MRSHIPSILPLGGARRTTWPTGLGRIVELERLEAIRIGLALVQKAQKLIKIQTPRPLSIWYRSENYTRLGRGEATFLRRKNTKKSNIEGDREVKEFCAERQKVT